uniref:Uncharacterized protein n=1 Tax=Arundo donax TaxID=35708 RepID=A0A0A9FBP3_ARUDO
MMLYSLNGSYELLQQSAAKTEPSFRQTHPQAYPCRAA